MSSNAKYHKLGSIVDQWVAENSLPDMFWKKGLLYATWGLRELHLDVPIQDVITCLLDVTDRKTVVLPSDYVDWTKVGIKHGQYVITIGVNDDLALTPRSTTDVTVRGLLSQNMPTGLNVNSYMGYYFFNYNGTSLFGVGNGLPSKGHFKVHNNGSCKEMLLDYDVNSSQIYLEYITDGFNPCSETVVNPYFANYVLKCMEFKYEEKDNMARTESSIIRKGRELFHAEKVARARANQIDKSTFLNITRGNFRLSTKA